MKELICKVCGEPRTKGRRLCEKHTRENSLQRAKSSYNNRKNKLKETFRKVIISCKICGKDYLCFKARKETSPCCQLCYKKSRQTGYKNNNYIYTNKTGRAVHRDLAEQKFNRKLSKDEIVHHIDENPKNNNLDNLLVLSRKDHGTLHNYLRILKLKNPILNLLKENLNYLERNHIKYERVG